MNSTNLGAIAIVVGIVTALAFLAFYRPVSASEQASYGTQCARWIGEEFGEGARGTIIDSWRKRGDLVFVIAVPDRRNSYSQILPCVVSPSTGSMVKPSAFDQSWRKGI
jgi:hypothetical protein